MITELDTMLAQALDWRERPERRAEAIRRLGDLGDPEAIVPLGVLLKESDMELQSATAHALSRLSAVDRLVRELADPSVKKRFRAAQVLGMLRDPTSALALIASLDDPEPRVREASASALYWLRDARARSSLVRLLYDDPVPDVRGAAAQALGALGEPEIITLLREASNKELDPFVVILIERSILRATDSR
jgi:HEAT repeat protein